MLQRWASIWDPFNNWQHWCAGPGVRPHGPEALQGWSALPGVRPNGPEAHQGVPLSRHWTSTWINLNIGSFGALSLVFGPSGLRLSRAGATLPGVRPLGPETLQEASTLGFYFQYRLQYRLDASGDTCMA